MAFDGELTVARVDRWQRDKVQPLLRSPKKSELERSASLLSSGSAFKEERSLWQRLVRLTPLEEIETKGLRECLRVVAPAMLVVLSWTYVVLANVNMVRTPVSP